MIRIELVFASKKKQRLLSVAVENGISAREALLSSALIQEFPEFDFVRCPLGVWSKIISETQPLKQGDRVEAYRQLRFDPRDARRELALAGRSMGSSPPDDKA